MKNRKYLLWLILLINFQFILAQIIDRTPTASTLNVLYHASHETKKAEAPFSDAVQVGNLFFLSGQIGMDHKTRTILKRGITPETHKTINNIQEVLHQHKLSLADVVKVTVILDDLSNFKEFNRIYKLYFPQKPARTTFAVQALVADAKIEIEVVAIKQNRPE